LDPTLVNVQDNDGKTPLHYVIANQQLELFKLFIQHNPRIDLLDKDGCSYVYLAVEVGNLEMVRVLLNKGADINSVGGKTSKSILQVASEF
jgi:26S proteasome non-ATPase regulatory subunit 10